MTDEQKERERKLKRSATEALRKGRIGWLRSLRRIWDTDPRLWEYCDGVIRNPARHNLYEQLAVLRFFALAKRHVWSPVRVRHFFGFYEDLLLDGTEHRQRYRLTPVQAFQFASIYGFEDDLGRRLTRTAYIFVPRKFSKTTGAAVMAVYDFLFGDSNAEAYMAANSEEQADKCFSEARAIMLTLDPKQRHYRINLESVTVKDSRLKRTARIKRLTASPRTKDGLFASLVIMDEYSQARSVGKNNGADLKAALTSSMGPRREPLTVVITTASEVVDGPCFREIEGAKAVLRGEMLLDEMCAFDLSVCGDFSALTFAWYVGKVFHFHTEYFFPEGALPRHFNRALYELWAKEGWLTLVPGPVIDYRLIVQRILEVNRVIRILNIGYDAYKAADPVNMLTAAGAGGVMKPVRQTYATFTAPVEVFEHGAKTGRVVINDNPINRFCFDNAVLDTDRIENCKPVKRAANMEIDGVIAMLMCMRLFIDYER